MYFEWDGEKWNIRASECDKCYGRLLFFNRDNYKCYGRLLFFNRDDY